MQKQKTTLKKSLNEQEKELFLNTISHVCDIITSTLGADGKTVIISERFGEPNVVTKDGYTVSKSIALPTYIENAANMFVQELTKKQVADCGDATTTTTLLFKTILEEAAKFLKQDAKPHHLIEGIKIATDTVLKRVTAAAQPIDEEMSQLDAVATTSANNDKELGKIIADAYRKAGRNALFDVVASNSLETSVNIVEGMLIERGWISKPSGEDDFYKFEVSESSPSPIFVMCIDGDLKSIEQLLYDKSGDRNNGILPQLARKYGQLSNVKIVIFANDYEGQFTGTINNNNASGASQILHLSPPSQYRRDILKDICAVTGAQLISDELGLSPEMIQSEHLGQCEKIVSGKFQTVIFGGIGQKKEYFDRLQKEIDAEENIAYKEILQRRLGRATSSMGVIKVGGATEVEMSERRDRVEDAVRAVKCAIDGGVVAGGGVTLLKAAKGMVLPQNIINEGVMCVAAACNAPIRKMAENADINADDIIERVSQSTNKNYGFNFYTKEYGDLKKAGVLDSAKVIKHSLSNAASMACQIIASKYILVENK